MEKCSILRRLPRRLVLCFYFTCVMLGACALFVLYVESDQPYATTSQNVIQVKALESESIHPHHGTIELPSKAKYRSSALGPSAVQANNTSTHTSTSKTSGGNHPRIFHSNDDHTYVYQSRTTVPPSKTTSPVRTVTKTTISATPLGTCSNSSTTRDSKLILLWTSFFGYWKYFPQERLTKCTRCRNCEVTTDRNRLRESHAVIFHARDLYLFDLPPVRYPHQRWVFYCLESPPYSDFPGLQHMKNMFNWTMTYRSDSDIVSGYGSVTKIRPSKQLDLESLSLAFSNKSNSVVWMSSHCPTHGGRDAYVKELRKYIDVDVYGTCGSSLCPPGSTHECLQEYAKKYKFFLAFENTICKDYITEKFYRTLQYNIIPVVFGGAQYDKFAPPNSFIDALSFKSPRHLAFFLSGVGKDFKLYVNYFLWRRDYVVKLSNQKECDLCSLLHRTDLKPTSYEDLRKWWVIDSRCQSWPSKL